MEGDWVYRDEKKKVLFVMGIEHKLDDFLTQGLNISLENIIVVQSSELKRIKPFDDLMRDIIITVYRENVDEIMVAVSQDDQKHTENLLDIISENKELQKKIEALDYLFTYCKPEFPYKNIREWLEGSDTLTERVKNTVEVIRHHSLMPPSVKVTELSMNPE